MELPHLELYWRRLTAPLPRSVGWWEAINQPLLRQLGGTTLWLLLAVTLLLAVRLELFDEVGYLLGSFNSLLVLLANLMVYGAAASQAAALLSDGQHDRRSAGPNGAGPLWFIAPLDSQSALFGNLLAALMASVPLACSIFLFALAQEYFESASQLAAAGSSGTFVTGSDFNWIATIEYSLLYVFRLPQLALFTMALCLALRNSSLLRLVPVGTALAAALAAEAQTMDSMLWPRRGLNTPEDFWNALLLLSLLALVVFTGLRQVAALERPGVWALVLACGLLGLPLLAAALQIGELYSGAYIAPFIGGFSSEVFRLAVSSFLPDVHIFSLPQPESPVWPMLSEEQRHLQFLGWPLGPAQGIVYMLLCWLMSLSFWWCCALAALNAARHSDKTKEPSPPV